MKYIAIFLALTLNATIMPNHEFIDKKGDVIKLEWIEPESIDKIENVYFKGFKHAYNSFKPEELGINEDFDTHIKHMFKECCKHVQTSTNKIHCIIAQKEQEIIGFAIFEMLNKNTIYLYSISIDPLMHSRGIGKHLIFSIFDKEPEAQKIILHTRKVNKHAIDFYKHLGFKLADIPANYYQNLSHVLVGLEFNRK